MGSNCTGCVKASHQLHKHYEFEQFPTDIEEYSPVNSPNLPKIKFDAILYNIKICDSPKEALSMKFFIQNVIDVPLPRKTRAEDTHEIKWKLKEKFQIETDAFDLRCKFLIIEALDEKGKPISSMKINLYMIAAGPYHHDFCFLIGNSQARLQFDLKVSQKVQTKFACHETEIQFLEKEYPGESFNFSISILKEQNQNYFESTMSYIEKIPFSIRNQGPILPLDECPSPIRIKGRQISKPISTSRVFWSKKKGEMPKREICLNANEIGSSLLHFVIWTVDEHTNSSTIFVDEYISVSKLFETDLKERTDETTNITYEERKIQIEDEKLYKNGQIFAEYSLKLDLSNIKYIKQMQACARTENGIIPLNPYIKNYGLKKSNREGKLVTIYEVITKIQKMNMELNKNIGINFIQRREIKDKMLKDFQLIKELVEEDLGQSFAIPSNEEEKRETTENQATLLSILGKVQNYLDVEQIFSEVSWHIVLAILKRGEFELSNIGFSTKQQEEMLKPKQQKLIKKKVENAITFQSILYKLFFVSLRIGYVEGRESPKRVVQMFKAYCYFRIPQYRELILKMIQKNEDTDLVQWKVEPFEKEEGTLKQQQNLILSIDWEGFFYRPLKNKTESEGLVKELVENLEGNKWLEQISKRSNTFFYFVYFLVERLNELGKKIKFLKWKYFPGYNKIVRSFLYEMKKKPIINYPKSMIQTSIHLLSNEKLANPMFSIIFQKTNIYESKTVMKTLQILGKYLDYLTSQKKILPPTFNYISFYKALKVIFQGDFSYSTAKALVLIYNHYLYFNAEFRRNITMYLLGRVFFKLFLHWSFSVRSTFYHLLLLKIDKAADIFNPDNRKNYSNLHEVMTDISQRYEQVITIVRNAEILRKNDAKKGMFKHKSKNLYEKMRDKLNKQHRKKSNTEKSSSPANETNSKEKFIQNFSIQKYSISELTRSDIDRSYSAIIKMQNLNIITQKSKKQVENQEEAEVHRIISDTNNGQAHIMQNKVEQKHKQRRKRRFSICGPGDFEIKQMQKEEFEYLGVGVQEFNKMEDAIKKYILQHEELPVCELDKLQIPIDEKDMRLQNVEDWE